MEQKIEQTRQLSPPGALLSQMRVSRFGTILAKATYAVAIFMFLLGIIAIMAPLLYVLAIMLLFLFVIVATVFTLGIILLAENNPVQQALELMGDSGEITVLIQNVMNTCVTIAPYVSAILAGLSLIALIVVCCGKPKGKVAHIVVLSICLAVSLIVGGISLWVSLS